MKYILIEDTEYDLVALESGRMLTTISITAYAERSARGASVAP